METILVTGVGGNVGQYIAEYLYQSGYEVTGIYRNRRPHNAQYKVIRCDLSEMDLEIGHVDAVIHAAASLYGNAETQIRDNITAAYNLIKWAEAKNIRSFIYMSSISVYGQIHGELEIDSDIVNPGVYGAAKYIAENLVRESNIPYRLVVGLPRMLGPYVDLDECNASGFLTMAKKILMNEDLVCYIPDTIYNNYMHVADLADFLEIILSQKKERYSKVLLGARDRLSMLEILQVMKYSVDSKSKIIVAPYTMTARCTLVSIAEAVQMGYRPKSSVDTLKKFMLEHKMG